MLELQREAGTVDAVSSFRGTRGSLSSRGSGERFSGEKPRRPPPPRAADPLAPMTNLPILSAHSLCAESRPRPREDGHTQRLPRGAGRRRPPPP